MGRPSVNSKDNNNNTTVLFNKQIMYRSGFSYNKNVNDRDDHGYPVHNILRGLRMFSGA